MEGDLFVRQDFTPHERRPSIDTRLFGECADLTRMVADDTAAVRSREPSDALIQLALLTATRPAAFLLQRSRLDRRRSGPSRGKTIEKLEHKPIDISSESHHVLYR
jgi:hypothetical protein